MHPFRIALAVFIALILSACTLGDAAPAPVAQAPSVIAIATTQPSNTPRPTATRTPAPTRTPRPTATPTPTATPPPTATPTPTLTPQPTATPIPIVPTATLAPLAQTQREEIFTKVWELVRDRYVYTDYRGGRLEHGAR